MCDIGDEFRQGAGVRRQQNPKQLGKLTAIMGLTIGLGLSSCMLSPREGSDDLATAMDSEQTSDRAMSALTKGDVNTAESYAQTALKRDPKDPYALLVAGLAYEASGRYDLARQYFQVIITNHPPVQMAVPDAKGNMQILPVVEIAQENLDKIDRISGRNLATSTAQSGKISAAKSVTMHLTDPEASIMGRFRILRKLLDEELITPDEYIQRRNSNVGAMLPLTGGAPATGLDRPIPDDNQVADRLRMLKASIEAREMQPSEAASERGIILDALLPTKSRTRAVPPPPPADMLEVADAVGRLERFRTQDLISPDELQKEKAALNQVLDKRLADQPSVAEASGLKYGMPAKPVPLVVQPAPMPMQTAPMTKAVKWSVALGSAGDEEEAKTLAAQIKDKFPEELGNKVLTVHKGDDNKWQVVSAMSSKDQARRLCKTLRLHRQSCEAVAL